MHLRRNWSFSYSLTFRLKSCFVQSVKSLKSGWYWKARHSSYGKHFPVEFEGSTGAVDCVLPLDQTFTALVPSLPMVETSFTALVLSEHMNSSVITYDHGILTVTEGGRPTGNVNIYSVTGGQLDFLKAFNPGHSKLLTCISHNLAMIATSSQDGLVNLHSWNLADKPLLSLNNHNENSISRIHWNVSMLVASGGDMTVSLWVPKSAS